MASPRRHRRQPSLRVPGAVLAPIRSGDRTSGAFVAPVARNSRSRETENEAELSGFGPFAVFVSVTTIRILAPLGYSLARVSHQLGDYLRIRELLSEALVDAASTTRRRPDQLMLYTTFLALHKSLISSDFRRICDRCAGNLFRFKLEQFRVFVKHCSPDLIRPEEETRHAGDPT